MVATNIDVFMKCRRLEMFFRTTNKEKYYQGNNVDNHTRFLLDQKKKRKKNQDIDIVTALNFRFSVVILLTEIALAITTNINTNIKKTVGKL